MRLSQFSRENRAKLLGSCAQALSGLFDADSTGETLFMVLVVDDRGNMSDVKNINRSAVPRLLREYAARIEKTLPNEG